MNQSDKLKFGTDGWRAVIGDQFTFPNVARMAQAASEALIARGATGPLIVGYDHRFLSDRFAELAARVAAANGLSVRLAEGPATTPCISWAVREQESAGAFILTASHNPYEYNGFKIKEPHGGSASVELTADIERRLGPLDAVKETGGPEIARFDPKPAYFEQLGRLVDIERLNAALSPRGTLTSALKWPDLLTIVDSIGGAAGGFFSRLFGLHRPQTDFSAPQFLVEIRSSRDPLFGGVNPEPIAQNLGALSEAVRREASRYPMTMGVALDGDGDRVGAVDSDGSFVNSHQIFALILRHLVEGRGLAGGVVKTFSTSRLVAQMTEAYGLPLHEVPIGFKYVCNKMLTDDILIGGEESGGIGIKGHLPERDGILCGLLLMELVVQRGKSLGAQIAELSERFGPHAYDRVDLHLRRVEDGKEVVESIKRSAPASVAGQHVAEVQTLDGAKMVFDDGSWLLLRASGTEPVLRVYAEAPDAAQVARLLAFGQERAQVTAGPGRQA